MNFSYKKNVILSLSLLFLLVLTKTNSYSSEQHPNYDIYEEDPNCKQTNSCVDREGDNSTSEVEVTKPGEVANSFHPREVYLFEKPDLKSKVIFAGEGTLDMEFQLRIEKIVGDFYYVTLIEYEGSPLCEENPKVKNSNKKGYIPIKAKDGKPSLWDLTFRYCFC